MCLPEKKKLRGPLQRACCYQAKHLHPDGIDSKHAGRHRHATPPLLPGTQRLLRQSVGDRPSTTQSFLEVNFFFSRRPLIKIWSGSFVFELLHV